MKKTLTILALVGLLTGCAGGDPDGEGANVVENDTETETSEPTTEPPAEETPTEDAQGTRSNPLPVGTTAQIGDWEVTVTGSEPDATETVMSANEFNDEPVEGRQFVMVSLEATYVGEDSGTFWTDMQYQFVGSGGNTFGSGSDDYCGAFPNNIQDQGETFPDATITGDLCFSVPSDQVDGGAVAIESLFSMDSDRVFFGLE